MSRHVVRAFNGVGIKRIVFPHEPIQPSFQISLHVGIGVLLNHEAGRSVSDKKRTQTFLHPRLTNNIFNLARKFMQPLTCRVNSDCFDHRIGGTNFECVASGVRKACGVQLSDSWKWESNEVAEEVTKIIARTTARCPAKGATAILSLANADNVWKG